MRTPMKALLLTVAACVLAAVALACGDDGELTIEEYFRRFEAISVDAQERFEPLVETLDEEFDSDAERIEAIQRFYDADVEIVRDYLDAIDSINPPAEAQDAHHEFLRSGTALEQLLSDVADRLSDVGSTSELETLLGDPEVSAATDRFDKACLRLQNIAQVGGVDVDLDCE